MNEDTTPITVQEKMCLGTVVDWTGRDGMMEGTNEIMYNYHWTILTTLLPFMISHSAIFWGHRIFWFCSWTRECIALCTESVI